MSYTETNQKQLREKLNKCSVKQLQSLMVQCNKTMGEDKEFKEVSQSIVQKQLVKQKKRLSYNC